jgi:8-amino-7-oxononanoate synthase
MMGLDFTSSLYLGFWHEGSSLKSWSQLTSGKPAALFELAGSGAITRRLAKLQGCDEAALARSTLHLFWDLFGIIAGERIAIFQDDGTYSIARWGIERAEAQGIPVYRFPHKDVGALRRLLQRGSANRRPVVVSDGICTACGCMMPVRAYYEAAQQAGGLLVIDDTQALGILGTRQDPAAPYGHGGGGSLRHQNVFGEGVIVISSLAKGFGVPLAVLSGSHDLVQKFKARSETRIHCSPPSAADIHATQQALDLNTTNGDDFRLRLAQLVQQFRQRLAEAGFSAEGGLFPVQTLRLPDRLNPGQVHRDLLDLGIRTLLRRGCRGGSRLSLILTARHRVDDVTKFFDALTLAAHPETYAELESG